LIELLGEREMEPNADVQKRLTTLEREMAALKSKLDGGSEGEQPNNNWFDQVAGNMKDIRDNVYDEFLQSCREVREVQNDYAADG